MFNFALGCSQVRCQCQYDYTLEAYSREGWLRSIVQRFVKDLLSNTNGMARSTFYYHIKRIGKTDGYDDLRAHIRKIYDQHKGRYGYRRITIQLRNDGVIVNHKTVRKLMASMSLKAKRKNQRYHSYKGDVGKVAPNVINRDFSADAPDQKWTTNVTQVKIKDRKLHGQLHDGELF